MRKHSTPAQSRSPKRNGAEQNRTQWSEMEVVSRNATLLRRNRTQRNGAVKDRDPCIEREHSAPFRIATLHTAGTAGGQL
ncbi:hypothetical protein F4X10_16770 [Candidatus Poribacteria bacterium]|nr:hypothetical protein [Candidatus Poribacteria bacterium]